MSIPLWRTLERNIIDILKRMNFNFAIETYSDSGDTFLYLGNEMNDQINLTEFAKELAERIEHDPL